MSFPVEAFTAAVTNAVYFHNTSDCSVTRETRSLRYRRNKPGRLASHPLACGFFSSTWAFVRWFTVGLAICQVILDMFGRWKGARSTKDRSDCVVKWKPRPWQLFCLAGFYGSDHIWRSLSGENSSTARQKQFLGSGDAASGKCVNLQRNLSDEILCACCVRLFRSCMHIW